MNAKTCKRLRREARAKSVGMPARHLIAIGQRVNQRKAEGKKKVKEGQTYYAGCATNDPNTTRGIYRAKKKVIG